MSFPRPLVMGILLALLIGPLSAAPLQAQVPSGNATPPRIVLPLPGKNSISNLEIKQVSDSAWMAEFDYFYIGEPKPAALRIELTPRLLPSKVASTPLLADTFVSDAQQGTHHASALIRYPQGLEKTLKVAVTLRGPAPENSLIVSQEVDKVIEWPSFEIWASSLPKAKQPFLESLDAAVLMIDSGGEAQLRTAKNILEGLISQNPKLDAAFVELARIAMKTNWGPQGLHQAEGLLDSALQIKPDSVNAKILLGYVYAHQRRFVEAQKLFVEAAKSDTRNLWLWANWGELLAMQDKPDQAILKYREAVARPMTHDTNDRAREVAYISLLHLLDEKQDLDGMEALYKQRLAEFGPGSCYSAAYARFKLQVRGDTQGAIILAKGALSLDCEDAESREILGLANYVKWADTKGTERNEALQQARIYLPAGPMPLYLLAASDRTLAAAKALIASGEPVDQTDNDKYTALALALQKSDLEAAKRLLKLGAQPETPVGYEGMPVALVPVLEGNIEAIRLFQQAGVDYSRLRFQGISALEFATQSGNKELVEVLGNRKVAL